jgi:hypothetical protein
MPHDRWCHFPFSLIISLQNIQFLIILLTIKTISLCLMMSFIEIRLKVLLSVIILKSNVSHHQLLDRRSLICFVSCMLSFVQHALLHCENSVDDEEDQVLFHSSSSRVIYHLKGRHDYYKLRKYNGQTLFSVSI